LYLEGSVLPVLEKRRAAMEAMVFCVPLGIIFNRMTDLGVLIWFTGKAWWMF
jgi:hypothetical protein